MKTKQLAINSVLALLVAPVSADTNWTAADLGNTLTRFGAEAAANEAGTIPAYDGGLVVKNLAPGDGFWPNPFENEAPLFRVTAENADEYKDQLSSGQIQLLKRYPDTYYMDIYPTHRTATFPETFLSATQKNASNSDCTSLNDGLSVSEACRGGLPFPLPKTGRELMWNYLLNYQGVNGWDWNHSAYVVNGGRITLTNTNRSSGEKPYYQVGVEGRDPKMASRIWSRTVAPARKAGEASGYWDYLDPVENDRYAWSYSTGQRRVRRAPEFSYDTPNSAFGSVAFYDEIFLFSGQMDRFNWTLEGKMEMFIPYSNYKLKWGCDVEKKLMESHINPECERWELHRVWVVSAEPRSMTLGTIAGSYSAPEHSTTFKLLASPTTRSRIRTRFTTSPAPSTACLVTVPHAIASRLSPSGKPTRKPSRPVSDADLAPISKTTKHS